MTPRSPYLLSLVHGAQYRRETGQERTWGYYQTIPQQPITDDPFAVQLLRGADVGQPSRSVPVRASMAASPRRSR
jgi:hypothetical protein